MNYIKKPTKIVKIPKIKSQTKLEIVLSFPNQIVYTAFKILLLPAAIIIAEAITDESIEYFPVNKDKIKGSISVNPIIIDRNFNPDEP